MFYPAPIAQLIEQYMKLPTIGRKTATRLAFYTLEMSEEDVQEFAKALISVKKDLMYCSICGNLSTESICDICQDQSRSHKTILVVESSKDILPIENMREYQGLYHVLHGVLSPMDGTGPEDLNIKTLIQRLQQEPVQEVILAMNATVEGEATASYLSHLIKPSGIKVTRLAYGLAAGSDIEYADELTLSKAIEGRREL